jgi:hypothetical protein
MSRKALRALALYLPFHLATVAVTWRDISRRPPEQVRGSKNLWRFASAVNTLGASRRAATVRGLPSAVEELARQRGARQRA